MSDDVGEDDGRPFAPNISTDIKTCDLNFEFLFKVSLIFYLHHKMNTSGLWLTCSAMTTLQIRYNLKCMYIA